MLNKIYNEDCFVTMESMPIGQCDVILTSCPYNKATYSSELCEKLLKLYCPAGGVVYDPFMGSGTTAVACKKMGLKFIGSEISKNQCEWAEKRLQNVHAGVLV